MEVIRCGNLTLVRFVNSIYASNTYLLHVDGHTEAWLIDCGDPDPVWNYLSREGLVLQGVFLTHVHYDHIYGLNVLKTRLRDLVVYTSEKGIQNLENSKYNFSKYHGVDFRYSTTDVSVLHDQSVILLFPDHTLAVFITPGHDWSSMTYRVSNLLFTGDAFIPGLKTVTTFPKSDRLQAAHSLEIIKQQITPATMICPGHGPIVENIVI